MSLLTPWVAYLPAEWLHLSGVLATVTCGIYVSRRIGRISTARVRLHAYAVWEIFIFILNGFVFVLIGLQVADVVRTAPMGLTGRAIGIAVLVAIAAVAARLAWVLALAYLPRWSGLRTLPKRHHARAAK